MEYKGKTVKVVAVSNANSPGFGAVGLVGEVLRCEKGRGFAVISSNGEYLRTSQVTNIEQTGNELTIKTRNSVYVFELKEEN